MRQTRGRWCDMGSFIVKLLEILSNELQKMLSIHV